jgi:sugar phosphate isomerase/epimerase
LLDELRDLRTRLGVRRVFLADSGFNVPLPEAKALCRALRGSRLDLEWATGLQPGALDDELAGLMRGAGCRLALLAGPGPLQEPLRDFDRHLGEFAAAAEPLQAAGVRLVATAVFGRPGEDRDAVERTLDLLARLNPFHVQLSAGVRILPFTPLAEHAKTEGVIRRDGDCLYPVRYTSPDLRGWLPRRLHAAARRNPSWHVV